MLYIMHPQLTNVYASDRPTAAGRPGRIRAFA